MTRPVRLGVAIFALVLTVATANAAINPREFQRGPEILVIEMIGRSVKTFGKVVSVQLLARVVSVERTATALKTGQTILISYERNPAALARKRKARDNRSWPQKIGPQILFQPLPPVLGAKAKAYLRKAPGENGHVYQPSAHQYSFEPVK